MRNLKIFLLLLTMALAAGGLPALTVSLADEPTDKESVLARGPEIESCYRALMQTTASETTTLTELIAAFDILRDFRAYESAKGRHEYDRQLEREQAHIKLELDFRKIDFSLVDPNSEYWFEINGCPVSMDHMVGYSLHCITCRRPPSSPEEKRFLLSVFSYGSAKLGTDINFYQEVKRRYGVAGFVFKYDDDSLNVVSALDVILASLEGYCDSEEEE